MQPSAASEPKRVAGLLKGQVHFNGDACSPMTLEEVAELARARREDSLGPPLGPHSARPFAGILVSTRSAPEPVLSKEPFFTWSSTPPSAKLPSPSSPANSGLPPAPTPQLRAPPRSSPASPVSPIAPGPLRRWRPRIAMDGSKVPASTTRLSPPRPADSASPNSPPAASHAGLPRGVTHRPVLP